MGAKKITILENLTSSRLKLNANADLIDINTEGIESVGADLVIHSSSNMNPHGTTKLQVGLGNVDDTPDLNKPVSIATRAAIDNVTAGSIGVNPTDLPSPSINIYDAIVAATYPNHGGLIVSSADLTAGDVKLIRTVSGSWSKKIIPIDLAAYVQKSNYNFGGTFSTKAEANAAIVDALRPNGRNYRDGTRVDIGDVNNYTSYWWRNGTGDIDLVKVYDINENSRPNLLSDGHTDLTFWSGTVGLALQSLSNISPDFMLPKSLAVSGSSSILIAKTVPVLTTDRVIGGGWFEQTIMELSGVTGMGFYGQVTNADGSIDNYKSLFTKDGFTKGSIVSNGTVFKSKIEDIQGDWVYISYYNVVDLPQGAASFTLNFYLESSVGTTKTFYVNNPTLLKDASVINSGLIYSKFAPIIPLDPYPTYTLKSEALAIKRENPFNDGNISASFWTATSGLRLDYLTDTPSFLVRKTITIPSDSATGNLIFYKSIPISSSERFVVGGWFNKTIMDVQGVSGMGFYSQVETTPGTIIGFPSLFTKSQLLVGKVTYYQESSPLRSRIEAVDGDWVYISLYNINDLPIGATKIIANFFLQSTAGTAKNFRVNNVSLLKGTTSILPYNIYDTSGAISGAAGQLSDKIILIDGDSIVQQGHFPEGIKRISGCTLNYSMAISGTTITFGDSSNNMAGLARTNAIKAATKDVIVLEGGVNDFRGGRLLGTLTGALARVTSSTQDYTLFYDAVLKRISQVASDNPTTPVLVLTPAPSFYFDGTGQKDDPQWVVNGQTQSQFADAIIEVCRYLSVPCFDLFRNSGINKLTQASRLGDGLHPLSDVNGDMLAKPIVGFLEAFA
jgi:hypothetical protein